MYTIVEAEQSGEGVYEPFGTAAELFYCQDDEVVLTGPAGTGKTRACLEKLDLLCWKYPGIRAAMIRKTRVSMTQTVMVTYGTKVLRGDHVRFNVAKQQYLYPNGSAIILAGMDRPSKILSAELDVVYINQAEELLQDDYETLLTRLRNNAMPYQQIIADCNPAHPTHWLRRRMDEGRARELISRHEDNPLLFDQAQRVWTAEGRRYVLGILERLSGVRRERLRYGRWVATDGAVYEEFDRAVHLLTEAQLEQVSFSYYIAGIDWGYTNPGVIAVYGVDSDGRLYLVEEVYMTQRLNSWWLAEARRLQRTYRIRKFVADPAGKAFIEEFKAAGIRIVAGFNNIRAGIGAVKERLMLAGDSRPRLYFAYDSVHERDEELVLNELPWKTTMEFDMYVWPPGPKTRSAHEVPRDQYNHGQDALRYVVCWVDGIGGQSGVWTM